MKSIIQKRKEASERAVNRAKLSTEQQLKRIAQRRGESKREAQRLHSIAIRIGAKN